MIEQKYYVKLAEFYQLVRFGFMDEQVEFAEFKKRSKDNLYKGERFMFTKQELSEVMDGALYYVIEEEWECGGGYDEPREWINPLIKLIPVENEDV